MRRLVLPLIGVLWALATLPARATPPMEAVVTVRTPTGGGSGFLVELDGRKFIVTNQHVLQGAAAADVRMTFVDGTEARPHGAEIWTGGDLIRLPLETDRAALRPADGTPEIEGEVTAYGNSLATGIVTGEKGRILGVGATEIEVTCGFVPGNSGGPLVDGAGTVVGVATLIRFGPADRATAGTRYQQARRFSLRLRDGLTWVPVANWRRYMEVGASLRSAEVMLDEVLRIVAAMSSNRGIEDLSPKNGKLAESVKAYQRLIERRSRMAGQPVSPAELDRLNGILRTTYRSTVQKMREAAQLEIDALTRYRLAPEERFFAEQRDNLLRRLERLVQACNAQMKAEPEFLTFGR